MDNYKVIYEDGNRDRFKWYERRAARILANHFQSDVILQRQQIAKTADIKVCSTNVRWELKNPVGDGKWTIDNNLRRGSKQSQNVVLDLSLCKMHETKAIARARFFLKSDPYIIKRLKIILKDENILDIYR